MTKLIGALVVLGVAQSCWYYVYLESPYDYYFRYCSSGCGNLAKTDGNFNSCCMPYTSGQSTPAVCTALSSSYAAMGTTCTWGNVPTTDAPTSTPVDPTYTPPPYTPPVTSAQANAPDDCTTEEPDDTEAATETFWITSITTTPCSTTSSAADAPTSSDGSCDCGGEGGQAAQSTNWEGNTAPASFTADNHRRGIIRRGSCNCSSATGSAPAETSAAAVTTSTPTATSSGDTCDCGGESGQAAESTNWEGNTAPTSFNPDNRRRRGIWQRGTCDCSSATSAHSEISATETSYAVVTSSAPAPTSSDDSCTCGDESGQAAKSTNWEGNTAPASFTPDNRRRRRGVMKRGKCDCGEAGANTGGIVASSYAYEGNTAPATFTADNRRRAALKPRNTAPASFAPDNRKRGYEGIVRGVSVGGKPENERRNYNMVHGKEMRSNHRRSPDHHSNVVENAERKIPTGFSRYYEKRNTAAATTCTSTTWITTDGCGAGAATTSVAAATDTDAPVTASVSATNTEGESGQAAESTSAAEDTESAPATTDDIPSTSVAWEGSGPPSSFVGGNRRQW